jgi:predicted DNA binding CopG/RHH family protein
MNEENLKSIQPGQSGAAHPASKPAHLHRSKVIALRVTAEELAQINQQAQAERMSVSKYIRSKTGLAL